MDRAVTTKRFWSTASATAPESPAATDGHARQANPEGRHLIVSRSVHINVPVERVFALLCNPALRASLNPGVKPLRVEIENDGVMRAGSVCHFRLDVGGRTVDYHTRVLAFQPNRRIVARSDTAVPFEITSETEPEDGGTRLTHTEEFEATDEMLLNAAPDRRAGRWLQWVDRWLPFLDLDSARRVHAEREELLDARLGKNLENWLLAIRQHLEAGR